MIILKLINANSVSMMSLHFLSLYVVSSVEQNTFIYVSYISIVESAIIIILYFLANSIDEFCRI